MSSGNGHGDDEGQDRQGGQSGGQGGQPGGQPGQGGRVEQTGQAGGQPGQGTQQGQAAGQPGQGGQAGQPGQGAQPRGQPGGAMGAGTSATDVLSQPAGQETIKYVVGLFAAIGVGVGFFGFLTGELLSSNVFAVNAAQSAFTTLTYVGAPLLVGLLAGRGLFAVGQDDNQSYLLGFVGGFAGHLALVFIGGVFTSLAVNGFQFGDALIAGILLSIGTGVVAAGATWVADWSNPPAL